MRIGARRNIDHESLEGLRVHDLDAVLREELQLLLLDLFVPGRNGKQLCTVRGATNIDRQLTRM